MISFVISFFPLPEHYAIMHEDVLCLDIHIFTYIHIHTSIDARLRQTSLLRHIVDGASAKAVKVCARFSVGVVSDRELFHFF